MKYDCNKTLDFKHEYNRLCTDVSTDCLLCPLNNYVCWSVEVITQEVINKLQKWSDKKSRKKSN